MATREEQRLAQNTQYQAHLLAIRQEVKLRLRTAVLNEIAAIAADPNLLLLIGRTEITAAVESYDPTPEPGEPTVTYKCVVRVRPYNVEQDI